jgi:hypothetical protein
VAILLLLVLALVVRPGRRVVGMSALLAGLTVVQVLLPSLRPGLSCVAALHVVSAAVILGLAGPLARSGGRVAVDSHPIKERAALGATA